MQVFLWTTLISVLLIKRSAGRMLVDQCGAPLVRLRIQNGVDAEWEAANWMAAIFNSEKFLCGGTVIHIRFVLTAAHCIENQSNLFVSLGAYNKTNPAQQYSVIQGVIHNGYSRRNMEHDIGLLKLSQDIQFGLDEYPICISLNPEMKIIVDSITTFDAYGWGLTETNRESELLQKVRLNRLGRSWCNQYLRNPLTSNQLCVGSRIGDTSRGDSGGPLVKNLVVNGGDKLKIQLAIVSFGIRNLKGTGIYTDVSSYAKWIDDNVNQYPYTDEYEPPRIPGTFARPLPGSGSPNRPPPGFDTIPPPLGAGLRPPFRFLPNPPYEYATNPSPLPTPRQAMFLYDECGGDDISQILVVYIFKDEFQGRGVMITDRYVLTTAKDLPTDAASLEVSIGGHISFEEVKVESIIKHPDFLGDHNHDIALLKLIGPPFLLGERKPICMLLQARHRQRAALSTNFTMFNYTASDASPLEVHPFNTSECSTRIQTEIEQDQICIEEPEMTKKYGQTGDIMGKKTVYLGEHKYVLVGIVSYSSNGLIILTNVLKYTDWIAGIVTKD